MPFKLKQLLKKQPIYILNKANDCVIDEIKNTESKTGLPAVVAKVRDPESNNNGHKCQIVTIKTANVKNPTLKTGFVKVSCDCSFFKYYCEYALSKWGAANIRYSNGQPSHITNPHNVPLCCKHLTLLIKKVLG